MGIWKCPQNRGFMVYHGCNQGGIPGSYSLCISISKLGGGKRQGWFEEQWVCLEWKFREGRLEGGPQRATLVNAWKAASVVWDEDNENPSRKFLFLFLFFSCSFAFVSYWVVCCFLLFYRSSLNILATRVLLVKFVAKPSPIPKLVFLLFTLCL